MCYVRKDFRNMFENFPIYVTSKQLHILDIDISITKKKISTKKIKEKKEIEHLFFQFLLQRMFYKW